MMNKYFLRKLGFVFTFLVGICVGASGLWLVIQNNIELQYYLLEHPTGNQPQTQVANFVQAVFRGDNSAAFRLWEIHDDALSGTQSELVKRRESVISNLISTGVAPDYMILGVEWWTTCCEPSVTCDSRNAGGARIRVQFLDKNGLPILYTFDVFTREQPYWGGAEGYPPRDWVIRDVYPVDQEPLFWQIIYEPQTRYNQSSEP